MRLDILTIRDLNPTIKNECGRLSKLFSPNNWRRENIGSSSRSYSQISIGEEWAYAGFFSLMSGAILTHLAVGDQAVEYIGPTLLLMLTIASWFYRPAGRKISNN